MSMERPSVMTLTGGNYELGEKPVSVRLCPPQVSHVDTDVNLGLYG
jgi:hypothetical protein